MPEPRIENISSLSPFPTGEMLSRLKEKYPHFVEEIGQMKDIPFVRISRSGVEEVMKFLRNDPNYAMDYLRCLTAVDWKDKLEVLYFLYSLPNHFNLCVRVYVPVDHPLIPSVTSVWGGANWMEREVYDLFGIEFIGHPNLERILLPEDWVGYPLRKDYPIQGHLKEKPIRWDDLFAQHKEEEKEGLWRE
ncbi:MAG: NADH-quinone oxidoreductase subunit C [bacterium]